ncbi:MAG TPA: 4-(cytidine 5'-diphospho)-2-C-methyl-D-erythritol kinase [Ktedonobacterales bacterium]|jgi:4-diphosphocytidyl-2-C-methyl-D-erythritol kinase
MERSVFVPAYAKINLTLAVLGRRADGYHDLSSVMQTISLHDTLRLTPNRSGKINVQSDSLELNTPDNLALRAAIALRTAVGDQSLGAEIELLKAIPSPGGLGGGSSDAASALLTLNALWGTRLPHERLTELTATLGSDVPYFLSGGTALIAGRGEHVTELPDAQPLWLVLVRPPVSVSTAAVYRALSPQDYTSAEDTDAIVQAIQQGEPLPLEHLSNSLEAPVLRDYPQIVATRDVLLASGAPLVRMSGSGPTLYASFGALDDASRVYAEAQSRGLESWLCHFVSRSTCEGAFRDL